MQNSVTNFFSNRPGGDGSSQSAWDVDSRPGWRLACLCVLMVLPLVAIAGRLVHLQVFLTDDYASQWEWTTETLESIPSSDGRILSADGTVLAEDKVHYAISMHYRWLEEPADPIWLSRKALALLDRKDRRNREKIEAAARQILAERETMWQRLAELSGINSAELTQRRREVQQRIEKIVASVERRQNERKAVLAVPVKSAPDDDASWWQKSWHAVKTAVTTPPTRTTDDPVMIPEEQEYYPVIDDVRLEVKAEVESSPRRYPGLLVKMSTDRVYPERSLAAHVVGNRTPLDDDGWKKRQAQFPQGDPLDYQPGDRIGTSGIERTYDRRLHGLRGQRRIVKDRRGEVVKNEIVREERTGENVTVSVHVPLQRKLESLLDIAVESRHHEPETPEGEEPQPAETTEPKVDKPASAGGSLVVIDVHSGDILAAVSAPRYDLNLLIHPEPEEWRRINEDPRRPFFPRVTRMTLPPGSVFKPLSAVALLESGRLDPDKAIECHGYFGDNPNRYRCYHSLVHGPTNLADALCRSCNVYFFSAADTIGPQQLIGWAQRFGFGQPTGIDLPGEARGNLPAAPSQETNGNRRNSASQIAETRGLAIGQGRLTVTPIQITRLMAAIANDGNLVTPRFVRDNNLTSAETSAIDHVSSAKMHRVPGLDAHVLQHIREGLERVVADPHGTGYKTVRMPEIAIAGKTGTAETGGRRPDHAWFAGYVPADRPRYAFCVTLEFGGSGGKTAGPVAHDLVQILLEEGLLEPAKIAERTQNQQPAAVPESEEPAGVEANEAQPSSPRVSMTEQVDESELGVPHADD
nr:cell division protein FtsI [uncultured bacterium]